jgi:hypothetical protein
MKLYVAGKSYTGPDKIDIMPCNKWEREKRSPIERVLTPPWPLYLNQKRGVISIAQFIDEYKATLRSHYYDDLPVYFEFLTRSTATLTCWCGRSKFCHKHIAVDVLEVIAKYHKLPFQFMGDR